MAPSRTHSTQQMQTLVTARPAAFPCVRFTWCRRVRE
ncbi:hypothetical protein [Nocardia salmonicida]